MKYRERIPTVDAFQYRGYLANDQGSYCIPKFARELCAKGVISECGDKLRVGGSECNKGDYVVKISNGIIVLDEIEFNKRYEPIWI